MEVLEKPQLINFIAKVLEDSGFKVYKNFKTSSNVIDIYAILPTTLGDFGVVVGCKNYDKTFEVGVEVLRKMEELQRSVNASKVTVVSSAYFSTQARNYALKKNIKLVDRDALTELARKYQDNTAQTTLDNILNIIMMLQIWTILCREEMQILQFTKTLYTVRWMSLKAEV